MEFIIDNRETIKNALSEKIEAKTDNLDIGDYLIKYNGVVIMIIERKTIADMASSIKDGRYREQKNRLLNNFHIDKILYLIEGDLTTNNTSYSFNKVNKFTIYSSIINCLLRDNIKVFHTTNQTETIDFLVNMYRKIDKQGLTFLKKKYTAQQSIINTVKPQKKGNVTEETVYLSQLCCIPGVSTKYAKAIINNYEKMYLFNKLVDLNEEERIKTISTITYETDNGKKRKLGTKIAEKINKYIF